MAQLGIKCDFCRLEITVVHSLQNFETSEDKFRNIAAISQYFSKLGTSAVDPNNKDLIIQLQFDNTQLACELKIIDSMEDESDKFTFRIWNVPEGTIFVKGDYLLFKYYWDSDPTTYTTYHGVIKSVSSKRTSADLAVVIKGSIVDQDILYNWSIYNKYPKLNNYSDVSDFIENELQYNFTTLVPGFIDKTPLSTPILTYKKSVGDILTEVCSQASESTGQECSWKFINNNTILLYKKSDLSTKFLNETYNMRVPSIDFNSLFDFKNNGEEFIIECTGIPTLVAGIVFYIDCTGVPSYITTESAYYVVNEIEHNITLKDGYLIKVYCDLANSESDTDA